MCWGSTHNRAGGIKIETYASLDEAITRLREIAERRLRRDYVPIATAL